MNKKANLVISTITLLVVLPAVSIFSQSSSENDVWNLEIAYWEYVKQNNIEGYLTLWDEQFVGWPGFSEAPVYKTGIAEWIIPLHKNAEETYDCELTKKAVRQFGDVVVVHYLVRDFMRSARTGEMVRPLDVYRITHTWHKRGDTWQIITGMSSAQTSKSD